MVARIGRPVTHKASCKTAFNARMVERGRGVFLFFLQGCVTGDFTIVAHVAQSEEHILGKDEVNGSIPFVGLES